MIKNRKISLIVTWLSSLADDIPARLKEKPQWNKIMVTFKVRGSAVSKLQSHYEETVYVLPQSPQKFLIPIWPASEE